MPAVYPPCTLAWALTKSSQGRAGYAVSLRSRERAEAVSGLPATAGPGPAAGEPGRPGSGGALRLSRRDARPCPFACLKTCHTIVAMNAVVCVRAISGMSIRAGLARPVRSLRCLGVLLGLCLGLFGPGLEGTEAQAPDSVRVLCPPGQHGQPTIQLRLERREDQVVARLKAHALSLPDQAASPSPALATAPAEFRPPFAVWRDVTGQSVQADGTPDPDQPAPVPFRLWIDPEGTIRHETIDGHSEIGSPLAGDRLAFDLTLVWGTTAAANDTAVLQLMYDHWGLEYNFSRPDFPAEFVTRDTQGRVTALQVAGYYVTRIGLDPLGPLSPRLPTEIGQLTVLQHLHLAGDSRHFGDGGGLRGEIPATLGQLSQLAHLDLSGNYLMGNIPAALGQLSQLTHLDLSGNDLTGPVPAALGQLRQLAHLDLSVNHLTGPVPAALGQLSHLTHLDLSVNHLTGPVPAALGQLSHLTYLALRGPVLNEFPSVVGQLTRLRELDLRHSRFTGIPTDLSRLRELTVLHLSKGRLAVMPDALWQLPQLQMLYLDHNQLTTLPPEVGQMEKLQTLNLSHNQLTALPPELGQLAKLQSLNLDHNQLTTLPPELGQLAKLQGLGLGINSLTTIPPELGQLAELEHLNLGSNSLTALPPELGQLAELEHLNLGSNSLTALPPELGQLAELEYLNLGNNSLTALPPELGQLPNLRFVLLQANHLTGCLPSAWRNLSQVESSGNERGKENLPFCTH